MWRLESLRMLKCSFSHPLLYVLEGLEWNLTISKLWNADTSFEWMFCSGTYCIPVNSHPWNNDTPLLRKVDRFFGLSIDQIAVRVSLILESFADQLTVMSAEMCGGWSAGLLLYDRLSYLLVYSTRINITLLTLSAQPVSNQKDASASQASRNSTLCWFMSWHTNQGVYDWLLSVCCQSGQLLWQHMNWTNFTPHHESNFWHLWA